MNPVRSIIYVVVGLTIFSGCKSIYEKNAQDFSHHSLKQGQAHSLSNKVIEPYSRIIRNQMNEVVSVSSAPLTRDGDQCTLGVFVCDALLFASAKTFSGQLTDVVLINHGGLRNDMPQGDITVGSIFDVMPFDNQLCQLKLSGAELRRNVKTIAAKRHSIAGMKIVMHKDSVISVTIGGKPLEESRQYYLLTSDYLANGGDGFSLLANPAARADAELKIRDAIIDYCRFLKANNKTIAPYTDDRLSITK